MHGYLLLEHVLEQIDEVRLFEASPFAKYATGKLGLRAVEGFTEQPRSLCRQLHHSDEFAARRLARNVPADLDDARIVRAQFFSVALGVLSALYVAPAPANVTSEHDVVRRCHESLDH